MRLRSSAISGSTQACKYVNGDVSVSCRKAPPQWWFRTSARSQQAPRSAFTFLRSIKASAAAAAAADAGDSQSVQVEVPEGIREPMTTGRIQSEDESRKKLWFAAIKPPMYTVAIVPILVAAAAAYYETGTLAISRCFQLNLASILIIAWLNLSNDAFDADMNVDGNKPESVVNLTGNRNAVMIAAWSCFVVGVSSLWRLTTGWTVQADARIAGMLGAAIAMGYLYQGPPFRLSYKGLGEPLCFLAFGPLATCAFYLAQVWPQAKAALVVPAITPAAKVCSVVMGITVTLILFCSHFHQAVDDKAAGKMSPIVRMGTANGVKVLQWSLASVYATVAVAVNRAWLPSACLGAVLSAVPLVLQFLKHAEANHTDPAVSRFFKLHCIRVHTAIGAALVAGLALPQALATFV